uniref:Nrg-2 n=1 Tax=Hofstenia miamia TaxID=442651 RepID=A0A8K1V9L7_HOFMI|nr:nrg-2 [Hofstenia miamia]
MNLLRFATHMLLMSAIYANDFPPCFVKLENHNFKAYAADVVVKGKLILSKKKYLLKITEVGKHNHRVSSNNSLPLEFIDSCLPKNKSWENEEHIFFIKEWKISSNATIFYESSEPVLYLKNLWNKLKEKQFCPTCNVFPPRAKVQERSEELIIGKDWKFKCPISGNPKPEFLWYKNDHLLNFEKSSSLMFTKSNGKLLKIRQLKEEDAGKYTCVGTNYIDANSSSTTYLTLPPPTTTMKSHVYINNLKFKACDERHDKGYCYNNGTCFMEAILSKPTPRCFCNHPYVGKRCTDYDSQIGKISNEFPAVQIPMTTAYCLTAGAFSLVIFIIFLLYVISKQRRKAKKLKSPYYHSSINLEKNAINHKVRERLSKNHISTRVEEEIPMFHVREQLLERSAPFMRNQGTNTRKSSVAAVSERLSTTDAMFRRSTLVDSFTGLSSDEVFESELGKSLLSKVEKVIEILENNRFRSFIPQKGLEYLKDCTKETDIIGDSDDNSLDVDRRNTRLSNICLEDAEVRSEPVVS